LLNKLIKLIPFFNGDSLQKAKNEIWDKVHNTIEIKNNELPKTIIDEHSLEWIWNNSDRDTEVINNSFSVIKERREHRRVESKNILDMQINVFILTETWKKYRCILSNICAWWMRIISKQKREKWEILKLNFTLWIEKFELQWKIVNNYEKQYWIKFINISKEDVLRLDQLISSIKLSMQR